MPSAPRDYLDLDGFEMTGVRDENERQVLVEARCTAPPPACSNCGAAPPHSTNGYARERTILHTPRSSKQVAMVWKPQRFVCTECGRTFGPQPKSIDDSKITTALRQHIVRQSLRPDRSFESVYEETGHSTRGVRRIFHEYVKKREHSSRIESPEVLGIDDVYLGQGNPHTILADLRPIYEGKEVEGTVLWLFKGSKANPTARKINSRFANRSNVKVVTMDMSASYEKVARSEFPDADIVVDKFHVLAKANDAVNDVRIQIDRDLRRNLRSTDSKQEKNDIRALRESLGRDKHLFLARDDDLSPRERNDRNQVFSKYPYLGEAYWLKEQLMETYTLHSRRRAKRELQSWREQATRWSAKAKRDTSNSIEELIFKSTVRALDKREDHVLNYFTHRVTNAPVEGLNRVVKDIRRMGRGYSLSALRGKLIFGLESRRQQRAFERSGDALFDQLIANQSQEEEHPVLLRGVPFSIIQEATKRM